MSRFSVASLAAALSLLSGCTSTWYTKPGATQAEFNVDDYACRLQARYIGTYRLESRIDENLYASCLRARGYSVVTMPPWWTPGQGQAMSPPASTSDTSRIPYCGFGMVWDAAKSECVKDKD